MRTVMLPSYAPGSSVGVKLSRQAEMTLKQMLSPSRSQSSHKTSESAPDASCHRCSVMRLWVFKVSGGRVEEIQRLNLILIVRIPGKIERIHMPDCAGDGGLLEADCHRRAATRRRLQKPAPAVRCLSFCATPLGERASAMALAIDGFSATMRRVRGSEDMMTVAERRGGDDDAP